MTNATTEAAMEIVDLQLKILRASNVSRNDLLKLFDELRAEVLTLINLSSTNFNRRRLNNILAQIDRMVAAFTVASRRAMTREMRDLVLLSQAQTAQALNDVLKANLAIPALSAAFIQQVLADNVFGGDTLDDFWKRQRASIRAAFRSAIKEGFVLGETRAQISSRVAQHPRINAQKNHIRTWVRSAYLGAANSARTRVFQQNSDIISEIQWLSTLDSRTSQICIALDGLTWKSDTLKPVGHSHAFPGPIAHPNCRSTQIPVLRPLAEINRASKKANRLLSTGATRASLDGQVSERITINAWLNRKGDTFARRLLGPSLFQLWKQGKMRVNDMIDDMSRAKSVAQLIKEFGPIS